MNCPKCSNPINKKSISCKNCKLDLRNETKLWEGRPLLFFGLLPDFYTKYEIITHRFIKYHGLFSSYSSEIELRRKNFSEILIKQDIISKLLDLGDVKVSYNKLNIYNIKNPIYVKELLRRVIFIRDRLS